MHLFPCFQSYFYNQYADKVGFSLETRNEKGVWPGTLAANMLTKQLGLVKKGSQLLTDANGKPTGIYGTILWKLQNDNRQRHKRLVEERKKGNS